MASSLNDPADAGRSTGNRSAWRPSPRSKPPASDRKEAIIDRPSKAIPSSIPSAGSSRLGPGMMPDEDGSNERELAWAEQNLKDRIDILTSDAATATPAATASASASAYNSGKVCCDAGNRNAGISPSLRATHPRDTLSEAQVDNHAHKRGRIGDRFTSDSLPAIPSLRATHRRPTLSAEAEAVADARQAAIRSNHLELNGPPPPTAPGPLAALAREKYILSSIPMPGELKVLNELSEETAAAAATIFEGTQEVASADRSPSLRVANRFPTTQGHWPLVQRSRGEESIDAPNGQQDLYIKTRVPGPKFSLHNTDVKQDRAKLLKSAWPCDETMHYGSERGYARIHHANALQNFLSYFLTTHGFHANGMNVSTEFTDEFHDEVNQLLGADGGMTPLATITENVKKLWKSQKQGIPFHQVVVTFSASDGSSSGVQKAKVLNTKELNDYYTQNGVISYNEDDVYPSAVPLTRALKDLLLIFVKTVKAFEEAQEKNKNKDVLFDSSVTDADRDVYVFFTTTLLSELDLADITPLTNKKDLAPEEKERIWRCELFLHK